MCGNGLTYFHRSYTHPYGRRRGENERTEARIHFMLAMWFCSFIETKCTRLQRNYNNW